MSQGIHIEPVGLKQQNHQLYYKQNKRVAFVSFPRSGSNWACAILSTMLQRAVEDSQVIKLTGRSGHGIVTLDSPRISYAQLMLETHCSGIVKTHSHFWDENSHVIYMFRDPRETLASFRYWHRKQCPREDCNSWTDFQYVRVFLPNLINSWCKALYFGLCNPDHIIFVDYRELLHRPEVPMRNMAKFLGIAISGSDLEKVYRSNVLDKMQSKKPGLIYRGAQANKGRGDFSQSLLLLIGLIGWAPYSILRVLARRNVKADSCNSKTVTVNTDKGK